MAESGVRTMPRWVTALSALVGLALLVVAVVYFAEPAKSLPSFFPGRRAGSSHHHTTHGLAALIVGLLALAGAWMTSAKKSLQ